MYHIRGYMIQAWHYRLDRFHRLIFVCVIFALVSGKPAAGLSTQGQSPQPFSSADKRFGAVESFFRPDDAAEAGIGWERIVFEWRYLQPNGPGDWDTSHIPDQWLRDARKGGRMVVGLLKNAPSWATGSDLLGAVPQGLDLPIDDPGNSWARFVRKVVDYYGSRWAIHHWIIYNEPDIRPEDTPNFEFAGTVEDYYQMVKVAYQVAKATDPKAVIHLAGFTFWQDTVHGRHLYLERFLRVADADPEAHKNDLFFDVLTVHVFAGTDSVWRMTQLLKSMPQSFGYPKPVWIDEFNVRITADSGWPIQPAKDGEVPVTLADQAAFIVQASALALAAGVDRLSVYKLYDNDVADGYEAWGLIRADGTRRPGFYAWETVIRYFGGTAQAKRFSSAGVTLVTLVQPERTVYVLWNQTTGPLEVRVQAVDNRVADAILVSDTAETETLPLAQTASGAYEFDLPPCTTPCFIQGAPRILVQRGAPQAVWALKNSDIVKIN